MTEPRAGTITLKASRVETLGDGIFAIVMTLLVFELRLPEALPSSSAQLAAELARLWPKFASFFLSFLTLGFSWIGHHNQYASIRRVDRTFLWINILFLLFIALVPFSAALLGQFPFERISVVLYAGNLIAASLVLYVHWWYASGPGRLVDDNLDPGIVTATKRRISIATALYVVAILVSFVDVRLGLGACVVVPIYFMFPGLVDRYWTK